MDQTPHLTSPDARVRELQNPSAPSLELTAIASADIAGAPSQGTSSVAGGSTKRSKDEIQTKLISSGFSLRFDNETPVSRIDQGGPDQEQR
jgi:hypothetical protein